jgi:hypothetical protein
MTEGKKRPNWAGIAALVAALVAAPGVLVNTYLDYKSRTTTELVQKSSHENVADSIESMNDDIDECLHGLFELTKEMSEMRGFVNGLATARSRRGGRAPASLPEPSPPEPSEEAVSDDEKPRAKRRPAANFDDIVQHVQSTGEVYQSQEQMQEED